MISEVARWPRDLTRQIHRSGRDPRPGMPFEPDHLLLSRFVDAHELGRQQAEGLVAWGISRITNDKHREVLELTLLQKLSTPEVTQRLDITADNLYQRRKRGLLELERILRDSRS